MWNLTRAGGMLYLALILFGIYAELVVLSGLVVGNDATMTANNILSHEALFRSGVVAHILTLVCSTFLMGILYKLFRSTSEYLAVSMMVFNLVAVAIEGVSILYEFQALTTLISKIL